MDRLKKMLISVMVVLNFVQPALSAATMKIDEGEVASSSTADSEQITTTSSSLLEGVSSESESSLDGEAATTVSSEREMSPLVSPDPDKASEVLAVDRAAVGETLLGQTLVKYRSNKDFVNAGEVGSDKLLWSGEDFSEILHIDLSAISHTSEYAQLQQMKWAAIEADLLKFKGLLSFKWANTKLDRFDGRIFPRLIGLHLNQTTMKKINADNSFDTGNYLKELIFSDENEKLMESLIISQHGLSELDLSRFEKLGELKAGNYFEGSDKIVVDGQSNTIALDDAARERAQMTGTLTKLKLPETIQGQQSLRSVMVSCQKMPGELDVTRFSQLEILHLGHNRLTDVIGFTEGTSSASFPLLQSLRINHNQIDSSTLNINEGSLQTALKEIWIQDNSYSGAPLELKGIVNLEDLRFSNNGIQSVDLTGSTNKMSVLWGFEQTKTGTGKGKLTHVITARRQEPVSLELSDFPVIKDMALYVNSLDFVNFDTSGLTVNAKGELADFTWKQNQFRMWSNKMTRWDWSQLDKNARNALTIKTIRVSWNLLPQFDARYFTSLDRLELSNMGERSTGSETNLSGRPPFQLYLSENNLLTNLDLTVTRLVAADSLMENSTDPTGVVQYPQLFDTASLANLTTLKAQYSDINSVTLSGLPSAKLMTLNASANGISDLRFLETAAYRGNLSASNASFDFTHQRLFYPQSNYRGSFDLSEYLYTGGLLQLSSFENKTAIGLPAPSLSGASTKAVYNNLARFSKMEVIAGTPSITKDLKVVSSDADLNSNLNPTLQFSADPLLSGQKIAFSGYVTLMKNAYTSYVRNDKKTDFELVYQDASSKDRSTAKYVGSFSDSDEMTLRLNVEDTRYSYRNGSLSERYLENFDRKDRELLEIRLPENNDTWKIAGYFVNFKNGQNYSKRFASEEQVSDRLLLHRKDWELEGETESANVSSILIYLKTDKKKKELLADYTVDLYHSLDYTNRQVEALPLPSGSATETLNWHTRTIFTQAPQPLQFYKRGQSNSTKWDVDPAQDKSVPLEGVEFQLYDQIVYQEGNLLDKEASVKVASLVGGAVSDKTGKVDFGNVLPGEYLLLETKTAAGYQEIPGGWQLMVKGSGAIEWKYLAAYRHVDNWNEAFYTEIREGETYLLNNRYQTLEIAKLNEKGELFKDPKIRFQLLPKAVFETGTPEEKEAAKLISYVNSGTGRFSFSGIAPGEYVLTEIAPAAGYQQPDSWDITVLPNARPNYLYKNTTTFISYRGEKDPVLDYDPVDGATIPGLTNSSYYGLKNYPSLSFGFVKETREQEALAGAIFTLTEEGESGEPIAGTEVTNTSAAVTGQVEFTGLQPGKTYRLTETKAPAGFQLPNGYWRIVMKSDGQTTITAIGQPPAFRENGTDYFLPNFRRFQLPAAGGRNDRLLLATVIGVAISSCGCLLFFRKKADQKK